MNDDTIAVGGMDGPVGSVTIASGDYGVITSNGISPLTMATISTTTATGGITFNSAFDLEDFLDVHCMNRVTVDHKVQEQELLKLKEIAPDYADEIKENIAKKCARDMVKKLTFTKKHDKDTDVHHFIGRVWMFTEDEIRNLINEARNV